MAENVIDIIVRGGQAKQEIASIDASLTGLGRASAATATTATAGLNQIEAEIVRTSATTRQYTEAERQRVAAMREASIAAGNSSLAEAQRKAALFNAQVELKNAEIAEKGRAMSAEQTDAMLQRVAAAERARIAATEAETVSVLEAARAEQQLALANMEVAETSSLTTRQMFQVGGAIDRVAGVAVPGARSLGLLAGSFSSALIPQLLLIAGISLLIGELLKLGKAKEEQIKLDEEGLKIDAERSVAMHTGTLFTKERATVMHDFAASNVALGQALADLKQKEKAEEDARRAATEALVSEKSAASEVSLLFGVFGQTTEQLTKKEAEATAARLTATAAIQKQVESYIKLALETHLSADATLDMARRTGAEIEVINALTAALDSALYATIRFKSGQSLISETRIKVAGAAAAAGEVLTHAEALRRYNAELAKGGDETVKLGRETELTEKNLKAFNETHHSGAAAARVYANTLVDLRKKMEDAQAALNQDNFAARDAKITNDIKAERDHLAINRRDREEALLYLAGREKALHDKVAQDRAIAEQRLQDEIKDIDIAGIQDAVQREEEMIANKIRRRELEILQEFGVTDESEKRVLEMKEGYGRQLERFYVEESAKRMRKHEETANHELAVERQLTAALQEEELKRTQGVLKAARDEANARITAGKFLLGQGLGASSAQITQFLNVLKGLGPEFADVDKNARTAGEAINYFRSQFPAGVAGTIAMKIAIADLSGQTASFGGVFKSIFHEIFGTIEGATVMFTALGSAFGNMFQGLVEGTKSTKALILQFVAELLQTVGQMAIAVGTILIFLPPWLGGNPGLGAALIAAGVAAMALAGVFRGLSSNAQKASQGSSSGAGAATAGTSAATQPARAQQPTFINVPSGQSSDHQTLMALAGMVNRPSQRSDTQPQTIILKLDGPQTRAFLESNTLTLNNIGGKRQKVRRSLGLAPA